MVACGPPCCCPAAVLADSARPCSSFLLLSAGAHCNLPPPGLLNKPPSCYNPGGGVRRPNTTKTHFTSLSTVFPPDNHCRYVVNHPRLLRHPPPVRLFHKLLARRLRVAARRNNLHRLLVRQELPNACGHRRTLLWCVHSGEEDRTQRNEMHSALPVRRGQAATELMRGASHRQRPG